jgi:hypothetical protein
MRFPEVQIARVQQYWDRRPCNIRHSQAPIGTRRYFDEVEARKYFVEYHIPGFAKFERRRGKKVLEIGCGIGPDTINFNRSSAPSNAASAGTSVLLPRYELFGTTFTNFERTFPRSTIFSLSN